MVSRLVISIRKVNDQKTSVSERISHPLVFAPNYELPVRTQTQVGSPDLYPSGGYFPDDVR